MPRPTSHQQMNPGFAGRAGRVFAVLAVLAAVPTVWLALADASAHGRLARFDDAPICAAWTPQTSQTSPNAATAGSCKTELSAQVESVAVSSGKVPVATLTLRTSDGTTVVADVPGERAPDAGEAADVTLWQGRCVIVRTDGEGAITTYDSPAWSQSNDAAGFVAMLVFTVVFESFAAFFLTWFTVDREKMAAAFLLAAVPVVVTVGLRAAHYYSAVAVAGFAVPLLVLGLYVTWPRLAWARTSYRSIADNRSVPSAVSTDASSE